MTNLLWSRKVRSGPENDMVREFLNQYDSIFNFPDLSRTVYTEPSLGAGFPDVLLVFWDESGLSHWNETRRELTRTDLKILHFIGQNEESDIEAITLKLGFSRRAVERSLLSLEKSNVVSVEGKHAYVGDLSQVFFVKKIIAIEAKMVNWRGVLQQAQMNQLFSSNSYILVPTRTVHEDLMSAISTTRTGLLEFQDSRVSIVKEADTIPIPVSFSSWLVNETVGRQHYDL